LASDWNARRGLIFLKQQLFVGEIPLLGLVAAGNPIEAMENPIESIAVPS